MDKGFPFIKKIESINTVKAGGSESMYSLGGGGVPRPTLQKGLE